tara:strand:+ start:331 stop:699 length:369 start_codon:yes stop_codon:yes gene_type:complete
MSAKNKKITLDEAILWTGKWRNTPDTSAKAFLVPVETIEGVLSEIKSQGAGAKARVYLGLDEERKEKLIFVGTKLEPAQGETKAYYKDLLPTKGRVIEPDAPGIWDFTEPCPPHVDETSALN